MKLGKTNEDVVHFLLACTLQLCEQLVHSIAYITLVRQVQSSCTNGTLPVGVSGRFLASILALVSDECEINSMEWHAGPINSGIARATYLFLAADLWLSPDHSDCMIRLVNKADLIVWAKR